MAAIHFSIPPMVAASAVPSAPTRSLDAVVDVETPEQVVVSYTIAGIGSRAAAAVIDYCLSVLVTIALVASLVAFTRATGTRVVGFTNGSWAVAILIVLIFAIFWGYYVFFEIAWDGQTPGKRQLGLRVVRDGGYSITPAASAVRNIMRIVDFQPGFSYGIGMITAIISPSGKRLGDYAAGTIVVRERVATLGADPNATAAERLLIAEATPRWREFGAILAQAQRRGGLRSLSGDDVSNFAARYREISADLARLQTASRGRQSPALFTLNRLVAGGHNLLYRPQRLTPRSLWRYLTISVPREIRRSAGPIAIAATLLFGPAAIAWTAVVQHPDVATALLPPGMIDRANAGVDRAKNGEGYIGVPELFRPIMSSTIIANNVQVSFIAFAGGILAGLGTIVALVFNGIDLGAAMGLYQSKGILSLILAFIAPHGVLELSAICIAGGAGLLLGSALVLPGALTRREALVIRGRRAIALVAGTIVLLIAAGLLEGFVSPIPWWTLGQKLTVSALTAILLILFVNLDRGRAATGA
jgi:uncharacterized membrane protein SpoIIM required for sporulation/uncharacterized RDD family membrane protein YckC